jgi:hypothetical protein
MRPVGGSHRRWDCGHHSSVRRLVAWLGAQLIYALVWLFGRTRRWADAAWLAGPLGDAVIFAFDVWSRTYFPTNIGLWLLVTTISRQVEQLNFPLSPLDTAHGIGSEIILLRRPDGSVRYTGWFRTIASEGEPRVLYTGFYMTARAPLERAPCVKVVFPMPNGNATVILRAKLGPDGALILDSGGHSFGEAGFYRVQARDRERARVWRVRTLREHFRVYVDPAGVLRCDHTVKFLGMRCLTLHYKMTRIAAELPNGHEAARVAVT